MNAEYIDSLFRKMYRPMVLYVDRVTHNHAFAEDCVQDAFCIAIAKYEDLMQSNNPNGWITNVVKNTMKNGIRKQVLHGRFFVSLEDIQLYTENVVDDYSYFIINDTCTGCLSKDELYLFHRVFIDKEVCPIVAAELGITLAACQKRVQRLGKKLKNELMER